jgi:hypothetical protein
MLPVIKHLTQFIEEENDQDYIIETIDVLKQWLKLH